MDYLFNVTKINETRMFAMGYAKKRFNAVFQLCLRNAIYYNDSSRKERIQYLKMLREVLNENKELLVIPKSLPKRIDLFLLRNNLLILADIFLKLRTKI